MVAPVDHHPHPSLPSSGSFRCCFSLPRFTSSVTDQKYGTISLDCLPLVYSLMMIPFKNKFSGDFVSQIRFRLKNESPSVVSKTSKTSQLHFHSS